jgi:hypothetical protein
MDCTKLKSIDVPAIETISTFLLYGCTSLETATFAEGPKEISSWAFNNCTKLKGFNIPHTVKYIAWGAFACCDSLEEITIPGNVEDIWYGAFGLCPSLKKVTIEEGVKKIGHGAFEDSTNIETVSIPGSAETIPMGLFENCTKLTNVTIGHGITTIGSGAFYNCTSLKRIDLPASVMTLEGGVFADCTNLEKVTISKELHDKYPLNDPKGENFDNCPTLTESGFELLNLAENPMTLKGKKAKVKYKSIKKKNKVLKFSKVVTFKKKGVGKLSFKKVSGNKKIKINTANGNITVQKKLKRGTYKVKVKVLALGTETVKPTGWKTVTFRIRVK